MSHDVELIKQDRRLRRAGRVAEGLPHIHRGQPNRCAFLLAQRIKEHRHSCLGAITATEPDWTFSNQVAHLDAVGVALANRDFVDADGLRSWGARLGQLRGHVLLVQFLHRVPIQVKFLGHTLDRGAAPSVPPCGSA